MVFQQDKFSENTHFNLNKVLEPIRAVVGREAGCCNTDDRVTLNFISSDWKEWHHLTQGHIWQLEWFSLCLCHHVFLTAQEIVETSAFRQLLTESTECDHAVSGVCVPAGLLLMQRRCDIMQSAVFYIHVLAVCRIIGKYWTDKSCQPQGVTKFPLSFTHTLSHPFTGYYEDKDKPQFFSVIFCISIFFSLLVLTPTFLNISFIFPS